MRKVISLVLTAAMLIGGMMIAPATASAETLDDMNVAAQAYYFGGSVTQRGYAGSCYKKVSQMEREIELKVKDGDSSKGTLALDGQIKAGEWGDPIVVVDSNYAANNGGIKYGRNMDFETASAENTYYYYLNDGAIKAPENGISYKLYMMWDEDYLYLAAETDDPDGHQSSSSADNAWNSDSLQFRVDTKGPNSSVDGTGYDARGTSKEAPFDWFLEPWADATYTDQHWNIGERVCNLVFTYTTANNGGGAEFWDGAYRYLPHDQDYTAADGESTVTYTKYEQHDVSWVYFQGYRFSEKAFVERYANYDEIQGGDTGVYGAILPRNSGSSLSPKFTTTYELAIPWDIIEEGYRPTAGAELGVSAAMFNAASGSADYNCWLGWGSGIAMDQLRWNPQTAGGSNSLTLSAEPYTTSRCTHMSADGKTETFTAATCTAPETCTQCGYQRGYASRHNYIFSDASVPTTGTNGTLTGTCKDCGIVLNKTIPAGSDNVKYSFKTTDDSITGKHFNSGFTTEWKDGPNVKKEDGSVERSGNIIYVDEKIKNAYDKQSELFPGEAVLDLYTNGSHVAQVDSTLTNADHTGTYFDMDDISPSYTYAMEVYFPDVPTTDNDLAEVLYVAGIRSVVGNSKTYGFYSAGLFRVKDADGADKFFFAIGPNKYLDGDYRLQTGYTEAELKEHALAWCEATPEDIAAGKWHTYAVMFDEDTATMMFVWDGEIKAAASDDRMQYRDDDGNIIPFFRRYSMGLFVRNIQVGDRGLIGNYIKGAVVAPKYTATVNGTKAEYKAGETVTVSAPAQKTENGKILSFVEWEGDVSVLADATAAEASFEMPENDVTLTAKYGVTKVLGDINGDGSVTTEDSNMIKQMLVGNLEAAEAADVDGDGSVTSKDAYLLKTYMIG